MRIPAMKRSALMLAHAVALTLAAGMAQAQVATAPPVPPVPPAQPDPRPPVAQVPVTPPEAATPATTAPATPAKPVAPPDNTPPAAAAQQAAEMARGDPVRWYKEDATEEQRLRTQRKEIGAAYEEAKRACRQAATQDRSQCMKDARATYEKELAGIKSGAGVR